MSTFLKMVNQNSGIPRGAGSSAASASFSAMTTLLFMSPYKVTMQNRTVTTKQQVNKSSTARRRPSFQNPAPTAITNPGPLTRHSKTAEQVTMERFPGQSVQGTPSRRNSTKPFKLAEKLQRGQRPHTGQGCAVLAPRGPHLGMITHYHTQLPWLPPPELPDTLSAQGQGDALTAASAKGTVPTRGRGPERLGACVGQGRGKVGVRCHWDLTRKRAETGFS